MTLPLNLEDPRMKAFVSASLSVRKREPSDEEIQDVWNRICRPLGGAHDYPVGYSFPQDVEGRYLEGNIGISWR